MYANDTNRIRIVFFGTSEFAIPALRELAESSDYQIAAVITRPDKPASRKQELSPPPVKVFAGKNNLPVYQPEKLSIIDNQLGIRGCDTAIVASYGKIIPTEILELPRLGSINIHPSLLPKYRGASPIHAAILNGDKKTGVSIMKMDEKLDHGPVVSQSKFHIPNSIFYRELHDKLASMGAEFLIEILPDYISGKIKPKPQNEAEASYTKIIKKDDARIDWSKSAEEIDRMVRAYHIWPVTWTTLSSKRLKIYSAIPIRDKITVDRKLAAATSRSTRPGTVFLDDNGKIFVLCGKNSFLAIEELLLEGGTIMEASDFIRGHNLLSAVTTLR